MQKSKTIRTKCKEIKMVLTDVDGVLTDGGRYYSYDGEFIKKFHVRDGMGVNVLLRNDIKTGILTKEKSQISRKWAKDMNVYVVYDGVTKKELALSKICKEFRLISKEIAYIGDDINDVEVMKMAGFSATPCDGNENAKKVADYVCKLKGGEGAFREVADLILSIKFPQKTRWY